jgi:hypothetical protein
MRGPSEVGRTKLGWIGVLGALVAGLAPLPSASASPAPTLRVRALESPPAQLERGDAFLTRVRVTRQGAGLRSAVLAYYLTPEPRVTAGAVRLAGRTSLASLQRRGEFERRVRIGLPLSVSQGRYYLTACVVVLRATGTVTRRPCRASQRRVLVVSAGPSAKPPTPTDSRPEEPADPTRIAIFPWVTSGGFEENWLEGLGLAALGVVGALVLLFAFLGEFLPSMGGKADYLARKAELDELVELRTAQFVLRRAYIRGEGTTTPEREAASAALTDDLEVAIQQKQQELTRERNRLLALGMPMYVILGGAFAVLFAANALQALLIGFGWTAVAERLGLRRELEQRDAKRKDAIEELSGDAKHAVDEAEKARLAADARAETNAQLALGFSEALREEAEARRRAVRQLETSTPSPPSPAPGVEVTEGSEEPE